MSKTTKRGRGRPCVFDWSKVNLQWKNKTDAEIAHELGCTVPNVYNRRRKLIAKAEANGKNAAHYKFSGERFTRSRYLPPRVKKEESAPVAGE